MEGQTSMMKLVVVFLKASLGTGLKAIGSAMTSLNFIQ
jgi:hypothetical protein